MFEKRLRGIFEFCRGPFHVPTQRRHWKFKGRSYSWRGINREKTWFLNSYSTSKFSCWYSTVRVEKWRWKRSRGAVREQTEKVSKLHYRKRVMLGKPKQFHRLHIMRVAHLYHHVLVMSQRFFSQEWRYWGAPTVPRRCQFKISSKMPIIQPL